MKTLIAAIAASVVIIMFNIAGAILFGWQRGGGLIPQIFVLCLAFWVFSAVKKKLNTTNQEE